MVSALSFEFVRNLEEHLLVLLQISLRSCEKIVRRKLGLSAIALVILVGFFFVVWRFMSRPEYVSQKLPARPQDIIITQLYRDGETKLVAEAVGSSNIDMINNRLFGNLETGIQSRLLTIRQSIEMNQLFHYLNSPYLIFGNGITSGDPIPPLTYYIILRYRDESQDQVIIINLPEYSMENVKSGISYDLGYSPSNTGTYGQYSGFVHLLVRLFSDGKVK